MDYDPGFPAQPECRSNTYDKAPLNVGRTHRNRRLHLRNAPSLLPEKNAGLPTHGETALAGAGGEGRGEPALADPTLLPMSQRVTAGKQMVPG